MNRFCSVNDPFVLPSQVHQVWYAPDPIISGLNYVMNAIPKEFYDGGEEYAGEVGNLYGCELNNHDLSSFVRVGDEDNALSREDIEPTVLDANATLLHEFNEQIREDSDHDDTLWDWMEAEEEFQDANEL